MTKPVLLAAVVVALALPAAPALAQSCFVADPIWVSGTHNTATATLSTRVATMGTNVATQRSLTLEMLLSAMKVQVAQTSTNGEREVN